MRSRPVLDGAEVGERAAEPAVDDEVAAASGWPPRWTISCAWRLVPTMRMWPPRPTRLDHEVVGALEEAGRLVEVDDVDAVARAVDERAHLRVPALGLVAEVDAGVEERAKGQGEVALQLGHGTGGRRGGFDGLGHWSASFRLGLRSPSGANTAPDESGAMHRVPVCAGERVDWCEDRRPANAVRPRKVRAAGQKSSYSRAHAACPPDPGACGGFSRVPGVRLVRLRLRGPSGTSAHAPAGVRGAGGPEPIRHPTIPCDLGGPVPAAGAFLFPLPLAR